MLSVEFSVAGSRSIRSCGGTPGCCAKNGKMRNAENRKRVKCGMLHVEKYCGTKGKMRNVKNAER